MRTLNRTDRAILAFALATAAYFGFLAICYALRFDPVPLGVVRELFTIPMILATAVVFVLSIARLLRNRQLVNPVSVGTVAALFVINCLIWAL